MAHKAQHINVIVHYPTTAEGWGELSCRVAAAHADAVVSRIKQLPCDEARKRMLLDAIIADARSQVDAGLKAKQTVTRKRDTAWER